MTSWVVSDSGISIASIVSGPISAKAIQLIANWKRTGLQVAVPTLFQYEIVSVMRKHVVRGFLTSQEASKNRDVLLAQPVTTYIGLTLLQRAYELAEQLKLPTAYDSQYLAVAEHLNCEFWTADERLYNAVNQQLTWVKWVGSL